MVAGGAERSGIVVEIESSATGGLAIVNCLCWKTQLGMFGSTLTLRYFFRSAPTAAVIKLCVWDALSWSTGTVRLEPPKAKLKFIGPAAGRSTRICCAV